MAQGTIKVTNGSVDVVGTGTAFTSMKAGSFLTFVLTGVAYTVAIDSIQSATALKLAVKFDGPTTSGVAFNESPVGSMALATMGVTVQAQKALRMMIADQTNWREVFSNKQTITVTLPDGTQYSGYSWGYISDLLKDINIPALEGIRDQTIAARNQAQTYATNASNSATAASTANTGAQAEKTAAETARTGAQTAQQGAAASATTAGTAATTATNKATEATNQAALAKQYADSVNPANLLAKANNLSDVADKATARTNLQLGLNDRPEFSAVFARDGIEVRTLSDSANPSASLVARRSSANGTTIVSSENRANANGSVEWIKRDAAGTPRSISLTEDNYVAFNGLTPAPAALELGIKSANSTSYIDFHYGAKYDYDARIFCDGMNSDQNGGGNLRIRAGYTDIASIGSTAISGGRLTINTSDVNVNCKLATSAAEASIAIRPATAGYAHYIIFNDLTKNTGYIGNPSNTTKDMTFYNYEYSTCVILNDRIRMQGGDTEVANLHVNGSSVYVKGGSGASNTHLWLMNNSGKNRAVIYSNDTQMLNLRSDNVGTGASGQQFTLNGATGECRATTFTSTSDERAKFWIKPVAGALDKICELNGVTYSMHTTIQDTVRKAGVIAQEVQKVLPEAVSETDFTGVIDKNCNEVVNPLGVDYSALSALYVEAFKEVSQRVKALEEKVLSLGGNPE